MSERVGLDKEWLLTDLALLSLNLDVKWGQCINLSRALAGYNVSFNTTHRDETTPVSWARRRLRGRRWRVISRAVLRWHSDSQTRSVVGRARVDGIRCCARQRLIQHDHGGMNEIDGGVDRCDV